MSNPSSFRFEGGFVNKLKRELRPSCGGGGGGVNVGFVEKIN